MILVFFPTNYMIVSQITRNIFVKPPLPISIWTAARGNTLIMIMDCVIHTHARRNKLVRKRPYHMRCQIYNNQLNSKCKMSMMNASLWNSNRRQLGLRNELVRKLMHENDLEKTSLNVSTLSVHTIYLSVRVRWWWPDRLNYVSTMWRI